MSSALEIWPSGAPVIAVRTTMRAVIEFAEILLERPPHPFWTTLRQVGITQAVGVLPRFYRDWREFASERPWDHAPLALYQHQVEEAGLRLAVIEDNPPMDAIRLGLPGRDEELAGVCTLIRNMGALGIPVWCYNWAAVFGWLRTEFQVPIRGGAQASGFDQTRLADIPPPATGTVEAERLWETLGWFLERVAPVAEEAGVTLAMHPDDPPVPSIRGVARIMTSVEAFDRLLELHPSPANAITFCQGNVTLMTGDVPAAIRRFGNRIAFGHFRDVRGTPERFVESFHDDGQTDMLACMRAYRDIGFRGVMRSDHTPTLNSDASEVAGYSHQARLHAIGYMTGLREAVLAEPTSASSSEP